ncbi:fibrobacter succinogenes major paralogous domain-containing protein [Flavobacteriales bacterium]|nr:fibrobacter succinogenes major paralogous domain-containing protein [Flavobacteriales bacterium]
MNRLLLVLLLAPFSMAAQSTLNDLDGDGCVGATDILIILGQYGECQDPTIAFVCGDSILFDNYWYETALIGNQCWFAENLRNEIYANGDSIPYVTDNVIWPSLSSGARCDFGNNATNASTYGRLYNWYAVNDMRGLCPSNWHVPTDEEFMTLEIALGMSETDANSVGWSRGTDEGAQLKASASDSPSWNGTNTSDFHGLSGGQRFGGGSFGDNQFGLWWSATDNSGTASSRILSSIYLTVKRDVVPSNHGLSVRCLKDPE